MSDHTSVQPRNRYSDANIIRITNGYVVEFKMSFADHRDFVLNNPPLTSNDVAQKFSLHCVDAEKVAVAVNKYLRA